MNIVKTDNFDIVRNFFPGGSQLGDLLISQLIVEGEDRGKVKRFQKTGVIAVVDGRIKAVMGQFPDLFRGNPSFPQSVPETVPPVNM